MVIYLVLFLCYFHVARGFVTPKLLLRSLLLNHAVCGLAASASSGILLEMQILSPPFPRTYPWVIHMHVDVWEQRFD